VIAKLHEDAEDELERAHDYYEQKRAGLGREFVYEFRRGVDRILENPKSWAPLDEPYRRYRLHRFPYGVVYRQSAANEILIVAVMNLSQKPGYWRNRDRG
jgi:plasmid stabilization system protein ParE